MARKTVRNKEQEIGNGKLYIAYGSNLNLPQMERRCPTATVAGKSEIKGYELLFRGVATVEPKKDGSVPVLLWNIEPWDEMALDRYEGWPHLYRKEMMEVELDGKAVSAMVYVMNDGRSLAMPSDFYYQVIEEGYKTAGFDTEVLDAALDRTEELMDQEEAQWQQQHMGDLGGFRL